MEEIEIVRSGLAIGDVQLVQNSVNVIFDSADLDNEALGNLLVAETLPDERQDFALARGEFDRSVRLELGLTTALGQLRHTRQECPGDLG